MDLSTQTHLTALRGMLDFRVRALRAEVQGAQQACLDAASTSSHDVADRKEEVTRQLLDGQDDAQLSRDLQELTDVEAALARLDAGRYGDCADCGAAIALERLRVQPAAQRCAHCQAEHERLSSR